MATPEKNVTKYSNGDQYIGSFNASGNQHGYGVYIWANGEKYEGNWKDGKFDGYGVYFYASGSRYEGKIGRAHV